MPYFYYAPHPSKVATDVPTSKYSGPLKFLNLCSVEHLQAEWVLA